MMFVRDIPEIPEIKNYDEELEAICEIIDDVRESIPVVPEVKILRIRIRRITESVQAGKEILFQIFLAGFENERCSRLWYVGWSNIQWIDERFRIVKDWIENLSEQVQTELNRLQEEKDTLDFETKTDFKTVHDRVGSLKDQIYGQLKEQSDIIWKLQKKLKENQKEFEIVITEKVEGEVAEFEDVTTETVKRFKNL